MKKNIILALIFVFLGSVLVNNAYSAPKKEKTAKAAPAKTLTGQVVALEKILSGGDGLVKKDEAKAIAEKGGVIALKVGTKIYFVMNEDGSMASKKLAGFANNEKVGVKGTQKVVNGFNVVIATNIENM